MTIRVALPPETEAILRARAATAGLELAEYAVRLLDEVLRKPSLDEILGPFRKQVAESGITDEELNTFFEELRDEVWRGRQDVKS